MKAIIFLVLMCVASICNADEWTRAVHRYETSLLAKQSLYSGEYVSQWAIVVARLKEAGKNRPAAVERVLSRSKKQIAKRVAKRNRKAGGHFSTYETGTFRIDNYRKKQR